MLTKAVYTAMILAFLVGPAAMAEVLTFPDTPVKQMTVEGKWQPLTPHVVDASKGLAYNSQLSPDQIAVMVIQAVLPEKTRQIFASPAGPVTADQLSAMSTKENPWILRYCMERGKPALAKINNHSLIQTSFFQEERIRVASPNGEGSMCMPAGKYEAHAFALNNGKLVHIYLQRSLRSEELTGMTEQIKKQFDTMIATAKWD